MPGEIVIVSAARTAVGSFNGAFAATPAHELGAAAIKAALARAEVDAGEVDEVILGQVLDREPGPEPGPSGGDQGGHSAGQDCLRAKPSVRLGPARGRARHAADRERRRQNRRRRRPGEHVAVAARRSFAGRHQDGRSQIRRYHDPRWPHGCVQRLPHGPDGRECRGEMAVEPP